jgi:hypothetical protein
MCPPLLTVLKLAATARAAERDFRPQGVAAMAASDILLLGDAQVPRTSFPDHCLAVSELFRDYASSFAIHHHRSPDTSGGERDLWFQQVQFGTAGVLVFGFAAESTVCAATRANVRQAMPMPVYLDRSIPPIKELAGGP